MIKRECQYKIEKNVPMPYRVSDGMKYPFDKMDIGDSFALETNGSRNNLIYAAHQYGQRHNKKFSIRKLDDNSIRCWRVK